MAVEQKTHVKGPGPDEIGARVSIKDAVELPQGSWVSTRTGLLYEAEDGQSLTAVICDTRNEYVLVGTPGKTPFPTMRQRAREFGIEPQF